MTKQEFVSAVTNNEKKLYVAAFSVVRNTEDARDAVSAAVTQAWEKLGRLKDEEKFDGWLLQITYNEAKKMLRHKKDRVSLDDISEPSYEDNSDLGFYEILSGAGLDEKSRKILIMRFVYGYELIDAAKMLGLPLSTVKTKYYRALDKIKKLPGIV